MDEIIGLVALFLVSYAFFIPIAWGSLEYHLSLVSPTQRQIISFVEALKEPIRSIFSTSLMEQTATSVYNTSQAIQRRVLGSAMPIILAGSVTYRCFVRPLYPDLTHIYLIWLILYSGQYLLALRFGRKLLHL